MKNLWLMCGIPGSGKSTWCAQYKCYKGTRYVSRDDIRFGLVGEDEAYFAREGEVFKEFIAQIQNAINDENVSDIYVDATHLNERSRNKVLDKLDLSNIMLYAVNFLVEKKTALERNELRDGRRVVPREAIERMYNQFEPAAPNERYSYRILNVKEENWDDDLSNFRFTFLP